MNDKGQEYLTTKENDENVGTKETIEENICNQTRDSEGKENSTKNLLVEGNEQTVVVPSDDAEPAVNKDAVELKEGETKGVVELEGDKNFSVEQDTEHKEGETKEVVEMESETNDGVEQDSEPKEVAALKIAGQDNENRLTLGEDTEFKESDAAESASKAAAEDETLKK